MTIYLTVIKEKNLEDKKNQGILFLKSLKKINKIKFFKKGKKYSKKT